MFPLHITSTKKETQDTDAPRNELDGCLKGYYRIKPSTWRKSLPYVNALKVVGEENGATFGFPGHNRGQAAPASLTELFGERPFRHDVSALDSLSDPEGPILEAQKQAAQVFGASKTWFLVGGTTCGIQAAIMGVCSPGDTLILSRNSHKSAISAMVLAGVIPKYIFPDYDSVWDIPTIVSPFEVDRAIKELRSEGLKPGAVFITSPTYQGLCSNIKEISALCHQHSIPLIVDEAHGAHFGFHPSLPLPALRQGADVVVQSTHKVLFSLTQTSMLHVSKNSSIIIDKEKIDTCLQSLQSTSPSCLLLASLDATTDQLKENPAIIFDNAISLALQATNTLKQIRGIAVLDLPCTQDPLRVSVGVYDLGISGYEADDFLYTDQKVISELPGLRFITYQFPPRACKEHVNRLVRGFRNLSSSLSFNQQCDRPRFKSRIVVINNGVGTKFDPRNNVTDNMKLTPREAFFAKKRKVDIKDAIGKICGELICPYPPGIPLMFPGEVVLEEIIEILLQSKADGAIIVGASDPLLSSMLICDI